MEKSVTRLLICTLGLVLVASGEDVLVHILRRSSAPKSCIHPSTLDLTILRHDIDDVTLSLKANQIVTTPSHVVLMSADDTTEHTIYQRVKVPQTSQAYHDVERTASFVVRCSHHTPTGTPYFIIEGTFFHEDSKFTLQPVLDGDVMVGPIDVTSHYVMTQVEEFSNPEDHDFIERLDLNKEPPSPLVDAQLRERELRRHKRQTQNYYIDVLPVIDFHLYEMWSVLNDNDDSRTISAISVYMTNVFTSMSLRLNTLSLRNNKVLNLRMATPHLSKSAATSPFSEDNKESIGGGQFRINVKDQIEAFKDWVVTNRGDLPENDHTMLFTGYTVYGGPDGELGNNLTRGLAFVGGICQTDGTSSSVVQDQMAYQSEPVAVHELGHSLGSEHDGEDNECNSFDRYIMSNGSYPATQGDVLHPFSFSSCSSDMISTKVEELEATSYAASCLEPESGVALVDIPPLNGIDQCRALFGQESYICRGSSFSAINEVCTGLYCYIPGTGTCRWLIPATGTCCGNGKYCIEGVCASAQAGQCVMNEVCPFEDQLGVIFVNAQETCQTMHPANCYNDEIHEKCCRACEGHRVDISGCEFGDKQPNCDSANCAATYSNGIKYNFYCCETCAHTITCQDKPGLVFQGRSFTCPEFIQTYGKHICYFQEIHIGQCCMTCEENRASTEDCPYGDHLNDYNCLAIPALGRACTAKEESLCCHTCPSISVPTPTGNPDPDPDTTPSDNNNGEDTTPSRCVGGTCGGAKSLESSRSSFFVVCVTVVTLCLGAML